MRRKGILKRIQSADEVLASLATYGERVADLLDERYPPPPAPEGREAFGYRTVFGHMESDLEAILRGLVTAEDELVRRQVNVANLRRQSEELSERLYDRQVAIRRTLGGLFGPEWGFELAAVSGRTPRDLRALVEQVDQTMKLLRQPEIDPPEPAFEGGRIDLDQTARALEAELEEARRVFAALERARKAAGEALVVKDGAVAEYDGAFPWVSQTLESLFRLVSETELAERICTSVRRVTRRQVEDGEPESSGESSSDNGSQPEESSASASGSAAANPKPSDFSS